MDTRSIHQQGQQDGFVQLPGFLSGDDVNNILDALGFSQGLPDTSCCENPDTTVACHAKPGDLLAHHALTVHWADGNRSANQNRRALGFIYYSVDAREDSAQHAAYQAQLAEEMRASGRI